VPSGFPFKSKLLQTKMGIPDGDKASDIIPITGKIAPANDIALAFTDYLKEANDGILSSIFSEKENIAVKDGNISLKVPSEAVASRIRNKSLDILRFISKRTFSDAINIDIQVTEVKEGSSVPYTDKDRLQVFIAKRPELLQFIQDFNLSIKMSG